MIRLIKTEFLKYKRYNIVWLGIVSILNAELKEGQTSPPKHFTDVICYERGIRNRP